MKTRNILLSTLTMGALTLSASAFAGPPVTITFKNLGTQEATYKVVTGN